MSTITRTDDDAVATLLLSRPPVNALGDLWGKSAIATIFGTMFFIHLVGDAAGAYVGGLVFDRAGSYAPVFAVAAVMALLGGLSVLSIRTTGTRTRAVAPRVTAAAGG